MQLFEDVPVMLGLFLCGAVGWALTRWLQLHNGSRVNGKAGMGGKFESTGGKLTPGADVTIDDQEVEKDQRSNGDEKATVTAKERAAARRRAKRHAKAAQNAKLDRITISGSLAADTATEVKRLEPVATATGVLDTTKEDVDAAHDVRHGEEDTVGVACVDQTRAEARELNVEMNIATAPWEDAKMFVAGPFTPASNASTEIAEAPAEEENSAGSPNTSPSSVSAEEMLTESESGAALKPSASKVPNDIEDESVKLEPLVSEDSGATEDMRIEDNWDSDRKMSASSTSVESDSFSGEKFQETQGEAFAADEKNRDVHEDWDLAQQEFAPLPPAAMNECGVWKGEAGDVDFQAMQSWAAVDETGEDGWMMPFEDIMKDPMAGSIACGDNDLMCQAPPLLLDQEAVAFYVEEGQSFTDGQRLYEPVIASDGQQFYSDGQQLYMMACVKVDEDLTFQNTPCVVAAPDFGLMPQMPCDAMDANMSFAAAGECHPQPVFAPGGIPAGLPLDLSIGEDEAWNACWDFVPSGAW
mmetsp:Transcript_56783/g.158105  ORF Transcript_56783/g.158105 Transcript_56783/m.158105 type:complete len:527 (-) Transcript_56783:74-1654(-)|eukprot:CAMPEP_0117547482 /NCGR_PEP_ID=MMETSP0784-20121206/47147_1 /TAXON_ID=39447 /ORGANISM="" /LENGTH=526 /DNA_ID=CAMNT_0005344389 /DNA_START=109 /DNA_END=1689 /DNA_ORIENTATION=-